MKQAVVALVVWLLARYPAGAQDSTAGCSPPRPWPLPGAALGHPDREFAACLDDRAYKVRNVHVAVSSAANGLIAECDVEVDHLEGALVAPGDSDRPSAQQDVLQQATAAVVRSRRCADR